MYTAREGLFRTLYYQLYGKSPDRMPDDVEPRIESLLRAIAARQARGDTTYEWPLGDGAVVVRRK